MRERQTMLPVKSFVLAAVALTLVAAFSANVFAEDPTFVQVIGIDSYDKEVRPGQSTLYNWTLRNVDSGADLTVVVEWSISGTGWSADMVTSSSIILAPEDLSSATVSVMAPLERGSLTSNLTVWFYVYEDGYPVQLITKNAYTSVVGAFKSADKVLGYFDNPLPEPLDNEWGVFLLDVVIWLVIAYVIASVLDFFKYVLAKKTTTMVDNIIIRIVRTPLLVLVFAFGVVQSLDALHMHIPEDVRSMVLRIYSVVLVFVIFYVAYKLFKEILVYYGKIVAKKTASKIDDVLIPVVEKIGVVVIGLAAFGYALGVLDVDLTMFVAGGVVVSMVLAFAAQETISNFFSGIFLLLDRPFAEGDTIILTDDNWYEVRRIGLRTTRLYRYIDAMIVSIPNNQLVNEQVARYSNVSDPARVNVEVGVAYGSDLKKVRKAIMDAVKGNEDILLTNPDRQPFILFNSMGDNALIFKVWAFVTDRGKRLGVMDKLTEDIYSNLTDAGIEIPFPQRTVWLRNEEKTEEEPKKKGK